MPKHFSSELLRRIRNEIPVIHLLRNILSYPCKKSENFDRFICPICLDYNTSINPNNNLARCFLCSKNFNTIDLTMEIKKIDFPKTIYFLEKFLPK